MELIIFIFIFLSNINAFLHCYNIDINSPYMKSIRNINNGLFGFSINIFTDKQTNKKHILVGAPFDSIDSSKVQNPGALYYCPISKELSDCIQMSFSDYSPNSLLGFVVDSNTDDGSIFTCAPRFLNEQANVKYVQGSCWQFNKEFKEVEIITNDDCLNSIKKYSQNYEYRNCLTGASLKSLNNHQILLTAPYSYRGKGRLIQSKFDPNSNSRSTEYLEIGKFISKYQLTGFSMNIGRIFREAGVKTILLGAPGLSQYDQSRSNLKFGQVVLVRFENNIMNNAGVIFGEQFGSAFGYSVLAMDLNGDGYDELVVGAPFTNNSNGQVFIFWNSINDQSKDDLSPIPLDIKNRMVLSNMKKLGSSQFGICIENIGDINKDLIMDLAVGAPFDNDGSGAVYVYLGNKNQILTLSQIIDGQMISPDVRGFGFSIFGKNNDLDDNTYPDIMIGAALSNEIIGVRTRPIIRVYADNMLMDSNKLLPYSFDNLTKCSHDGQQIPCVDLSIKIHYYYLHLTDCPSNNEPRQIEYQVELDQSFVPIDLKKRVYFEDKSNIIKQSGSILCKSPKLITTQPLKTLKILFPFNIFFNISAPIELKLKWNMNISEVPKRDFNGGPLIDLATYPVLEHGKTEITNQINFGAGCTTSTCKPILTMQPSLTLPLDGDKYLLYIGNITKFKLNIQITNIATSNEDRAYGTLIRIDYQSKYLDVSSSGSDRRIITKMGLIHSVISPLNPQHSDKAILEFLLTNDFIQSTPQLLYINISVEAMSHQAYLNPVNIKIKIKMIADIDLKVLVEPDNYPYQENKGVIIPGFMGITSEEKIGPKTSFTITISNKVQNSVVLSSKLVVYFPWEISGNPNDTNGQFMLYLLRLPLFSVSGGKKKITCDAQALNKANNIINTRLSQSKNINSGLENVVLRNVSMPKNVPKLPQLIDKLIFDSNEKSDWEDTVVVDCLKGTARCIPIVCDLGPLSRQRGEINLRFEARLWVHTLIENFLKYKFVYINIPIYWVPLVNYDIILKNPEGHFKLVRVVASNLQKPKPPPSMNVIFAVLIAVSIGVLLLATIIIILYQCKFFRRKNQFPKQKKPIQS